MPDTLVRGSASPRQGGTTSTVVRLAAVGGPLLTAGVAVAAAWAGVPQHVRLPHWWGPWPWRSDGARNGYVMAGIAQIGRQPLDPPVPGVPPGLIGQLVRFAVIGVLSTLAYIALFVLLRGPMPAQAANLTALLITAVANTAANRRLTFGIRGRGGAARHQFQGLIVFAVGLGLTSATLALLHAADPHATQGVELALLVAANALATLLRFVLFRAWVFRGRSAAARADVAAPVLDMGSAR